MAMDNMTIRKTQLKKLDEFVHTLYKETQTFKQYGVDLKDLEILYLHIHDLIQELLQCDTTDEFMAMLEELHKAVAGVLIVIAPGSASQVAQDLKDAHDGLSDMDVNEFLKNMKVKEKPEKAPKEKEEQPEEEFEELSEEEEEREKKEIVDTLDLGEQVSKSKKAPKKKKPEKDKAAEGDDSNDKPDPLGNFWDTH